MRGSAIINGWYDEGRHLAYAVLSYGTRYGTLCYESIVHLYNLHLKINLRILYRIGWITVPF
jgi:hypothetical protein